MFSFLRICKVLSATVLFVMLGFSCRNHKISEIGESENSRIDTAFLINDWVGNYHVMLPSAESPGVYRRIAIAPDSTFTLWTKAIDHFSTVLEHGKLEWDNDSSSLSLNNGSKLSFVKINGDIFIVDGLGNKTLTAKISQDAIIPPYVYSYVYRSSDTPSPLIVQYHSQGESRYVEVRFDGHKEVMPYDHKAIDKDVYVFGYDKLVVDPDSRMVVYYQPNKKREFRISSPEQKKYLVTNAELLEALYYDYGDMHNVLLLNPNGNIFMLDKKGHAGDISIGKFVNDSMQWLSKPDNGILKHNGKEVAYLLDKKQQ